MRKFHHTRASAHIYEYMILFLLVSTGFLSFLKVGGKPSLQLYTGMVTGVAYILWGIYHHYNNSDLNWKVVIEYTSIGLFGMAALWMLLSYLY